MEIVFRSARPFGQENRIGAEREAMNLRRWQFTPSEVLTAPNPYSAGCVGFDSWEQAAAQWRELVPARRR